MIVQYNSPTEERIVGVLFKAGPEGLSATEIGKKLGLKRNTIVEYLIGRGHGFITGLTTCGIVVATPQYMPPVPVPATCRGNCYHKINGVRVRVRPGLGRPIVKYSLTPAARAEMEEENISH